MKTRLFCVIILTTSTALLLALIIDRTMPTIAQSVSDVAALLVLPNVETRNAVQETNLTNPATWASHGFAAALDGSDVRGASSATQSNGNWQIECVDCPKELAVAGERALRLDPNGHLYLAYGGDHLYYAYHDGADWHIETIDHTMYVGAMATLALDEAGHPHVTYLGNYPSTYQLVAGDLKYAYEDATGWHNETVDSGEIGATFSLALDQAGYPHIGYSNSGILKYAFRDATGWHVEIVDDQGEFESISLALDENNDPHISYVERYLRILKYASRQAATWDIQTLVTELHGYTFTSLVLDQEGYPHISYNSERLWYAFKDATEWHFELTPYLCAGRPSLALDGESNPHISFEIVDLLIYTYKEADGWHYETVDSWGDHGHAYSSLALDEQNEPHIGYFEYTDHTLNYLHRSTTGWQEEKVDSGGFIDSYNSLVLDREGHPHISYRALFDTWNHQLKYAYQNATGWHIQTIESGETGYYSSLALDEAGFPHISFYDRFRLKYAYENLGGWHIETVDTGDLFGFTSVALDGNDYPHIAYVHRIDEYYYYAADLRYASLDATGWHMLTVDSGAASDDLALALDSNDYPHISYFADNVLKYARYDGAVWQIETMSDKGGNDISLALDETNQPHISYYDPYSSSLKYAWRDSSSWHIETVDLNGDVGRGASIALDKTGRPHISYHDNSTGDVKYARYDGVAWRITTVDSTGDAGGVATSLALNDQDAPSISYVDTDLSDLKYAWPVPAPLFLDKRATPRDGLRGGDTLTYTLTLSGPGLDVRLWDTLPSGVQYITASLTGTVTPTAVYSPTTRAVFWEGTLPTNTVATVRFQVTPGLSGTAALSAPIVNRAWLTDTVFGRSVATTVIVNGWRVYLPLTLH